MDIAADMMTAIESELSVSGATVEIMRFAMPDSFHNLHKSSDEYRLDLCLTPRPRGARACFPEKWGPHRFEPVGDIFLAPPGHSIDFRGEHGRQASVICHLRRDLVERWLDGEPDWNDRRLEAILNIVSPHVRVLMLRLAEEVGHPGLGREAMVENIAGQLAIELARFCAVIEDAPVTGGLAAWRLRLIRASHCCWLCWRNCRASAWIRSASAWLSRWMRRLSWRTCSSSWRLCWRRRSC